MLRIEMLRPTEAAVVAGVSLRDVNRALDEGILPNEFYTQNDGRRVASVGCVFIAFYVDSAARLTSEERLSAIRETAPNLSRYKWMSSPSVRDVRTSLPKHLWMVRHHYLTIDLAPFADATAERFMQLQRARDMVVVDKDILGGMPVVRGTRVPVYDVAASVAAGNSTERILAAYPTIDAEKIDLAATYAKANPARGRPRTAAELPAGVKILVDRHIPRSRRVG